MKKTLLIAALSVAAVPAMASKARLTALNAPAYTTDIQDVFSNPGKATQHGEWLTFEMGPNGNTNALATTTHAEGGFSRSMGDARWGFYLGHQETMVTDMRSVPTFETATPIAPDNTVNLFYGTKSGDLAWGAGLGYSKTDKKTLLIKQDAVTVSAGVVASAWDVGVTLLPMNNYKDEHATTATTTRDLKGKLGWNLSGNYYMDDMTYFAGISMNAAKVEDGAGTEKHNLDYSNWNIGAEKNSKVDGGNFFYGAKYKMTSNKDKGPADTKTETSELPVYAGIEADANSWMVLRASIQQNFLLGTTQTGASTNEKDSIANNTTVAAGAGLKFGKLMIDGTLEGASSNTAALNGNSLLANGAITYMF